MKLTLKLCTLFVALAPLTSCGYVQHKLLMGGISSGGDKPTDEPTTETADPTTGGDLPQQKDEAPAPAPLIACGEGPQIQGGTFRAEETLAAIAPCEANSARRLACVVDFSFVGESTIGKVTATTATGETARLSYRTCGKVLTVTLESQPGVAETHAFEIQDDGQRLVHVATGRGFRRI